MDTTRPMNNQNASRDSTGAASREPAHHESALHFFAREAKLVLRWAVFIFGAATVLTFMTFFFFAIIPAIALIASLVLLLIAHSLEQRTVQPGDPHDETAEDQARTKQAAATMPPDLEAARKDRVEDAIERKSARMIAGIIVSVAVVALVVAGAIFGRELFIIGGFILFAYMLLVATPVWLGWLNDEAEEEAHRIEGRPGSDDRG